MIPTPRRPARLRGATLIESMVSAAILAIGLLGLFAAQTTAAQQNAMAAKQARGAMLAEDLAAAVRLWPFGALPTNATGNDSTIFESKASLLAPAPGDYELDINSVDFTATASPETRRHPPPTANVPGYSRYLAVKPLTVNGVASGATVVIAVAWQEGPRWRVIHLTQAKYDPSLNRAPIPGL